MSEVTSGMQAGTFLIFSQMFVCSYKSIKILIHTDHAGQLGQADALFNLYSGGHCYGHSLPTADSSRPVVSNWQKYGHWY